MRNLQVTSEEKPPINQHLKLKRQIFAFPFQEFKERGYVSIIFLIISKSALFRKIWNLI